jgi:hypothetical protein
VHVFVCGGGGKHLVRAFTIFSTAPFKCTFLTAGSRGKICGVRSETPGWLARVSVVCSATAGKH